MIDASNKRSQAMEIIGEQRFFGWLREGVAFGQEGGLSTVNAIRLRSRNGGSCQKIGEII
jgi:hypothetical protein